MAFEAAEHHEESVRALAKELRSADRAQCIMAPGTGAAVVQARLVEEAIESGKTRFFAYAYTSDQLRQNAEMFRKAVGPDVQVIIACSPADAGEDAKTGIRYLSEIGEIRAEMRGNDNRPALFLATYDSAEKLSQAQRLESGAVLRADLALADQAHRTAGGTLASKHAHVLSGENVAIAKRVFFTGTPRATEVADVRADAISMADGSLYGRRAVDLSFSRALERDLVADYDIWVSIVTEKEVADQVASRNLNDAHRRNVLGEIAMRQVMKKTGHRRALTFHNRVENARSFAETSAGIFRKEGLPVAHVEGDMGEEARAQRLALLSGDAGIVSNVRLVGEDMSFPRLEMVAFLDRTESAMRTVQAATQATRPDPGNRRKRAALVVPILLEERSERALEHAAKVQGFSTLVEIASAMRLADDTLDGDVRRIGRALEKGDGTVALDRLKVAGLDGADEIARDSMERSIQVATLREICEPFDLKLGRLEEFIETENRLPTAQDDAELGAWVTKLRLDHRAGRIPEEQAGALDDLPGWRWVDPKAQARTVAQHLIRYAARAGDTPPYRIAPGLKTGAEDLGELLFDSQKAGFGMPDDAGFAIGSRRKAEALSQALAEHAEKTGDMTLSRDVARTELAPMKGMIVGLSDADGQEYLSFSPLAGRILHFDTGLQRSTNDGAAFRLRDLESEQEEDIRSRLAAAPNGKKRAFVTLELAPVISKNGRYSLEEARVLRIVDKPRREMRKEAAGETAVAGKANTARSGQETHRVLGRFVDWADEAGKPELRFQAVQEGPGPEGPSMFRIRKLSSQHKEMISKLPSDAHAVNVEIRTFRQREGLMEATVMEIDTGCVLRPEERTFDAKYVRNRLEDRHIAGLPEYSAANFASGAVSRGEPATSLNPNAAKVTAGRVRQGVEKLQEMHADGSLPESAARRLDEAPGFSWVEKEQLEGRLSAAIIAIARRHGEDILSSSQAREGNNGLANSLRVADEVLRSPKSYPSARGDLSPLKEAGLILKLKAYAKAESRKSAGAGEKPAPGRPMKDFRDLGALFE